jgi:hypothetical protein
MIETPKNEIEGEDIFPEDEEERAKIIEWVDNIYTLGDDAKFGYKDRWEKYYKMYRSYVKKRPKGDWKSRVWMPVAFYVIETITPRLVAQLPKFTVAPVGAEDTQGAELMERLLDWATDQSELYLELVKALKSALLYGTGVLKTSYEERTAYAITREPVVEEVTAEVPTGFLDVDGAPITQSTVVGQQPVMDETTGKPKTTVVRRPYISYAGPIAEAVDIDDFFVDPVADSIETARWVIHRVYRDKQHLEKMFKEGVYHRPESQQWDQFLQEHSSLKRQASVDLGMGTPSQKDVSLIELLEVWTPKTLLTVAGTGGQNGMSLLLRAERNPWGHGEIPFARIVDHLVPHEFWGIGELEPLEGIQDLLNSLWNSRIDNVKLVLNSMFLAVMDYIEDPSDLQVRPSGVIRVKEGVPLSEAIRPMELGEVTQSSYTEAAELERMTEKVSGVSPYQTGTDSASVNRTATGVALISEQGNTRFAHKVRIAELTGFRRLARHFASIIQQFSPPEIVVRTLNEVEGFQFLTIPAEAIGGRYDFDIEAESSTQTESIRREQTLSLFQMLAADPYMKPLKIRADVLKTFGRKNVDEYMYTEEELMMIQQQAAMEQAAMGPAEEEQGATEQAVS